MRVRDDDGTVLNAEFSVEVHGGSLAVVLESSGGRVAGSPHSRNHQYVPALALLLDRLRDRRAVLRSAAVASSRVTQLPEARRTLLDQPQALGPATNIEQLWKRPTPAQRGIGRTTGSFQEGNNRKRIRIQVDVSGGQGFGLDHAERQAVERRAMDVAMRHLVADGYDVDDVERTESYDIDATRADEHLYVEVKGTTSAGEHVVLTKNEVDLMIREYPNTMLIVVSGITVDRSEDEPSARDGVLRCTHPWQIDRADLTSLAFRYTTKRGPDIGS